MEKQASQDVTNKEQEKFLKKSDPWYYTKVGPMKIWQTLAIVERKAQDIKEN